MKKIETFIQENPSGKKVYIVKDLYDLFGLKQIHRSDGPAIITQDGRYGWHWEGHHCFTFDIWCKYARENSDITEEEIVQIKLTYGA